MGEVWLWDEDLFSITLTYCRWASLSTYIRSTLPPPPEQTTLLLHSSTTKDQGPLLHQLTDNVLRKCWAIIHGWVPPPEGFQTLSSCLPQGHSMSFPGDLHACCADSQAILFDHCRLSEDRKNELHKMPSGIFLGLSHQRAENRFRGSI